MEEHDQSSPIKLLFLLTILYFIFQDKVPPKDTYIHVRVLDDIGEVLLSDQSVILARHSMHFLKRIDAEPFISQVGCLSNQLTSIAYKTGFQSSQIFILV